MATGLYSTLWPDTAGAGHSHCRNIDCLLLFFFFHYVLEIILLPVCLNKYLITGSAQLRRHIMSSLGQMVYKDNHNLIFPLFFPAITDLLVSLTAMPFYTINYAMCYWPFGEALCWMWIFMDWGMTFASIFTLVAISIDRYWAACWSSHYRNHNSRNRTLISIALIW